MTGLARNTARLFANKGTLFTAAFDHPQMYGVMDGLVDPLATIAAMTPTALDGFILNPGIFNLLDPKALKDKKLIMRASLGGNVLSNGFSDHHAVIVSPKHAVQAGADAALIMLVLGGDHDKESMAEAARTAEAFHEYSMPVIMEVLAADFSKNNDSAFVRTGARIAAEIGADAVKAFYCEDFGSVVRGCPVPVILAGGPKDGDIVKIAATVVQAGCKGFAFGRNLFQSEHSAAMVKDLDRVLRG